MRTENTPLLVSAVKSRPGRSTQILGGHASHLPVAATRIVVPRAPPGGKKASNAGGAAKVAAGRNVKVIQSARLTRCSDKELLDQTPAVDQLNRTSGVRVKRLRRIDAHLRVERRRKILRL